MFIFVLKAEWLCLNCQTQKVLAAAPEDFGPSSKTSDLHTGQTVKPSETVQANKSTRPTLVKAEEQSGLENLSLTSNESIFALPASADHEDVRSGKVGNETPDLKPTIKEERLLSFKEEPSMPMTWSPTTIASGEAVNRPPEVITSPIQSAPVIAEGRTPAVIKPVMPPDEFLQSVIVTEEKIKSTSSPIEVAYFTSLIFTLVPVVKLSEIHFSNETKVVHFRVPVMLLLDLTRTCIAFYHRQITKLCFVSYDVHFMEGTVESGPS